MKGIILMGLFSSLFSNASAATLKIGDAAPSNLQVQNELGETIQLDYSSGYTLVYFYPKADTPGCTKQACSLRDSFVQLSDKGVRVYGASTDKPADQLAFKKKYRLPFTLIADTEKKLVSAFGVPLTMGYSSRQAFLFKDGKLVWLDRSASTDKQAEDVLNFIAST